MKDKKKKITKKRRIEKDSVISNLQKMYSTQPLRALVFFYLFSTWMHRHMDSPTTSYYGTIFFVEEKYAKKWVYRRKIACAGDRKIIEYILLYILYNILDVYKFIASAWSLVECIDFYQFSNIFPLLICLCLLNLKRASLCRRLHGYCVLAMRHLFSLNVNVWRHFKHSFSVCGIVFSLEKIKWQRRHILALAFNWNKTKEEMKRTDTIGRNAWKFPFNIE